MSARSFTASILLLVACAPSALSETMASQASVSVSINAYGIDERGFLHIESAITNNGSQVVCMGDPPSSALLVEVVDRTSGYIVFGEQKEELIDGRATARRPDRRSLHISPSERIVVKSVISPIEGAYLVDSSYARVRGHVDLGSLSMYAEAVITDCKYASPDDSLRNNELETFRSRLVPLRGDLGDFIK